MASWAPTAIGLVFAGASLAASALALRILSDPRREPPEVPDAVRPLKKRLNRTLRLEARLLDLLLAYALLRLPGTQLVGQAGCGSRTVAAFDALAGLDHLFMFLGAAAWLAGLAALARHVRALRRVGWGDPKTRDLFALHLALVPIALVAFVAALTIAVNRFCAP